MKPDIYIGQETDPKKVIEAILKALATVNIITLSGAVGEKINMEIVKKHITTVFGGSTETEELPQMPPLLSMSDPRCRDGRYLLLFLPSGYTTIPVRCHAARWTLVAHRWVDYAGDNVGDYGSVDPVGWLPMPEMPT